jgi:uncharacterized protein YdcH (DUF465 family)
MRFLMTPPTIESKNYLNFYDNDPDNMKEIKYFKLGEREITLGSQQEYKLKLIRKEPEAIKAFDAKTKRRFKELELIDDNGKITTIGVNILNKLSEPDGSFVNYGQYLRWCKKRRKEERNKRRESPCGCTCNTCLKGCTAQFKEVIEESEEDDEELARLEGESEEAWRNREYDRMRKKYTTIKPREEEIPDLW